VIKELRGQSATNESITHAANQVIAKREYEFEQFFLMEAEKARKEDEEKLRKEKGEEIEKTDQI